MADDDFSIEFSADTQKYVTAMDRAVSATHGLFKTMDKMDSAFSGPMRKASEAVGFFVMKMNKIDPRYGAASAEILGQAFGKLGSVASGLAGNLGSAGNAMAAAGPAGMAAAAGVGAAMEALKMYAMVIGGAITGVVAVVGGLTALAYKATSVADNIQEMAARSNMGAVGFQKLEFAGRLAGVSIGQISNATFKLQTQLSKAPEKFAKLGLNVAALKDMRGDEMFTAWATAVSKLPAGTERTSAAMSVLGRSASALMPLISDMGEASDKADEMGYALTELEVNAMARTRDQIDALVMGFERFFVHLGSIVAQSPAFTSAIDSLATAMGDLNRWVIANKEDFRELFDFVTNVVVNFAKIQVGLFKNSPFGIYLSNMTEDLREALRVARYVANEITKTKGTGLPAVKKGLGGYGSGGSLPAFPVPGDKEMAAIDKFYEKLRKQTDRQIKKEDDLTRKLEEQKEKLIEQANKASKIYSERFKQELVEKGLDISNRNLVKGMREQEEKEENIVASLKEAHAKSEKQAKAQQKIADETARAAREAKEQWLEALNAVSGILSQIDNQMADIASAALSLGTAIASGDIGGMLSGAFGVGSAIGGLFGESDEERAARNATQQAIIDSQAAAAEAAARAEEARQRAIADTTTKINDLMGQIKAFKKQQLGEGIGGLKDMFASLGDGATMSQERLDRMGRVGMAMFSALRKQGVSYLDALEQMGPALDAAIAAAEAGGLSMGGGFGALTSFRERVQSNQGLVSGVEGWGQALEALRTTGSLDFGLFGDSMAEANAQFADLTAAGFTNSEALRMMAPGLLQLREAAQENGWTLDESTQSLINQAEAAGAFEGLTDPMDELVEMTQLMVDAMASLVETLGGELSPEMKKFRDEMAGVMGEKPGGMGLTQPSGSQSDKSAAGVIPLMGEGGILTRPTLMYGGESGPEAVIPLGGGFMGGGGSLNMDNRPTVVINGAGRTDAEIVSLIDRALRNNNAGLAARVQAVVEGRI